MSEHLPGHCTCKGHYCCHYMWWILCDSWELNFSWHGARVHRWTCGFQLCWVEQRLQSCVFIADNFSRVAWGLCHWRDHQKKAYIMPEQKWEIQELPLEHSLWGHCRHWFGLAPPIGYWLHSWGLV
jgi:hypothetical protein